MSIVDAARGVCDLVWVIDSSDPETASMSRLLRRLGTVVDVAGLSPDEAATTIATENPDGILALADSLLVWTAEVAERLKLPFIDTDTARRLTDKFAQRAALRAAGLPAPGSWVIDENDIDTALSRIRAEATFPAVLKPRHGEGSRDTVSVAALEELTTLFSQVHESTDGTSREFVLEEYIPDADYPIGGEGFAGYVSVESFVYEGEVTHLGITGRTPAAKPFRETGLFIPSAVEDSDKDAILDTAARAATALGVHLGCLHTEIKLTPTGPVVIEVNGRIGGGIPESLEVATGVRFLPIAIRLALNGVVDVDAMPPCTRVGYHLMVQAPESLHRVTAVEGLDDLRAIPGVDDISLTNGPGKEVNWRNGNQGSVFTVFGSVSDHDEFRRLIELVPSLVQITGE